MERPFANARPLGPFVSQSASDDTLKMYDRKVEPLVVIRDFHSDIEQGVSERKYMTEWGTFSYRLSNLSTIHAEFRFEESSITEEFSFNPMDARNRGGHVKQGSSLGELGGNPSKFAGLMKQVYGDPVDFEFVSLDAASQGHSRLTNYEFEYELIMNRSEITNTDIDERLRGVQ
mgnify:CR=1 FL=1